MRHTKNVAKLACLTLVIALPFALNGQTPAPGSTQDEHHDASADHMAGVNERGDHAMGFSHEKTTHHFGMTADGGFIEVVANDPTDAQTLEQIRMHLAHIVQRFSEGDFDLPMLTHGRVPPGVPVMQSKREGIAYKFVETANGGKVRIRTADPEALKAVHEFLAFQIQDHKTGDSSAVMPSSQ